MYFINHNRISLGYSQVHNMLVTFLVTIFLFYNKALINADPKIKWIPCSNPELYEKCLNVQFENGETDLAELNKAFKDDHINYVGYFKNMPDVRVFASIPNQELGFDLIHVSFRF